MTAIDELFKGMKTLKLGDPSAMVELLCKIHDVGSNGTSAHSPLSRLIAELQKSAVKEPSPLRPHSEDDLLPDFRDEIDPALLSEKFPGDVENVVNRDTISRALLQAIVSYRGLLERHNRDFDEVFARDRNEPTENRDEVIQRLQAVQVLLIKYPIAAQAAFSALVKEGRQYAKTEHGQQLKQQLSRSALLSKARTLFEGLSGGMLVEDGSPLPSTYVDAFLSALDRDLEEVLGDLGGVDRAP